MKPILEAFNRANIPYVCGRRQSFLLSREGLDITALLHIIANPRNSIALATVLRSDLVGIGDEALLRVRLLAGSLTCGLNRIAHDNTEAGGVSRPRTRADWAVSPKNLKRWRADQSVIPLEVLIVRALSDCGFQWMPGTVIAANVESFLHLARTGGEERGLAGFSSGDREPAEGGQSRIRPVGQRSGQLRSGDDRAFGKGTGIPDHDHRRHGQGHAEERGSRDFHARFRSRAQMERPGRQITRRRARRFVAAAQRRTV